MKYRIVELTNGTYKCQYKTLFWWEDSAHAASNDFESQLRFVRQFEKVENPKIIAIVWP